MSTPPSTPPGVPSRTPPSPEHRARVDLPEWMRNPPQPRPTLGRRLSDLVEAAPRLREARRAIWHWRDRSRFSERHPVVAAITSFVAVAVVATVLVAGTAYLFARMRSGNP
ncbi:MULTISPECIES: hypothetical protein [unclassified Micromonospora]|uniref:hypothetical protein n=1 Tax=unclassified Micromonospora TaxID=2617518 RepID=UPI00362FBE0E